MGADLKLTGFKGEQTEKALKDKRRLLEKEGVVFVEHSSKVIGKAKVDKAWVYSFEKG